jgi:hypothetical protein
VDEGSEAGGGWRDGHPHRVFKATLNAAMVARADVVAAIDRKGVTIGRAPQNEIDGKDAASSAAALCRHRNPSPGRHAEFGRPSPSSPAPTSKLYGTREFPPRTT